MSRFSILVPVYNVSDYLEECLDSIINQTFKDIEIIIVNDASPDPKDDKICKKYEKKDKRIKYLKHTKNLGLGGARNTGIENATGEYLIFVDSDDYIRDDLCEIVNNTIDDYNPDAVAYGAMSFFDGKPHQLKIRHQYENKVLVGKAIFNEFIVERKLEHNSWGFSCKKQIFTKNNIYFPNHLYHQDLAISPQVFYHTSKMVKLEDLLYYYRTRPNSIVNTVSKKHIDDPTKIMKIIQRFLKEENFYKKYSKQFFKLFFDHRIFHPINSRILKHSKDQEESYKLLKYFIKDLYESFDIEEIIDNIDTRNLQDILNYSKNLLNKRTYSPVDLEDFNSSKVKQTTIFKGTESKVQNIAIAFDNNFSRQAIVMLFSLFSNAKQETSYNVFCLIDEDVTKKTIALLKKLFKYFNKHNCTLLYMSNAFDNTFEIRGISKVTYFRLVLHRILTKIDSILYIDVDTIVLDDLSDIRIKKDTYIRGVIQPPKLSKEVVKEYNLDRKSYFNAGVVKINLEKFREKSLDEEINQLIKNNFVCQDQDILNILCYKQFKAIHPRYNVHGYVRHKKMNKLYPKRILDQSLQNPAIIHWTGPKPWKETQIDRAYIWWKYYKEAQKLLEFPKFEPDSKVREIRAQAVPIKRLSSEFENIFFGYYDLAAYNEEKGIHLGHRVDFIDRLPGPQDEAEIVIIDKEGKHKVIDKTKAWNFQQGSLLQFRGSKDDEIIYNIYDEEEDKYKAKIKNFKNSEEEFIDKPIATISKDGKTGISINFSRLYDYRPGYGYCNKKDPFFDKKAPEKDGIFLINVEENKSELLYSYKELWEKFVKDTDQYDKKMIINHVSLNPSGNKLLILLRFFSDQAPWPTITLVADLKSKEIKRIFGFGSHYDWLDDKRLFLTGSNVIKKEESEGQTLHIIDVDTEEIEYIDEEVFKGDGHCTVSPDGKYLLYDSYPNDDFPYKRLFIYNLESKEHYNLGYFYNSFEIYDNVTDVRCDLHARWSSNGKYITFDSIHEGYRGIYQIKLEDIEKQVDKGFGFRPHSDVYDLYQKRHSKYDINVVSDSNVVNDHWYRFGQLPRRRKILTIGKLITKKLHIYWLLKPIARSLNKLRIKIKNK